MPLYAGASTSCEATPRVRAPPDSASRLVARAKAAAAPPFRAFRDQRRRALAPCRRRAFRTPLHRHLDGLDLRRSPTSFLTSPLSRQSWLSSHALRLYRATPQLDQRSRLTVTEAHDGAPAALPRVVLRRPHLTGRDDAGVVVTRTCTPYERRASALRGSALHTAAEVSALASAPW